MRKIVGVLLFFSNFVYAFAEQDVQESKKHNNNDTSIANHTHEYAQNMNLEPLAEEAADHYLPTLALEGLFTWKGVKEGIKNVGKLAAAAATFSAHEPPHHPEACDSINILRATRIISNRRYGFRFCRHLNNCIIVNRSSSSVSLFHLTHKVEGPMLSRFSASPRAVREALETSSRTKYKQKAPETKFKRYQKSKPNSRHEQ